MCVYWQIKMDALAKQISMVSFGIIVVIGLLGLIQGKGLLEMFQIGVRADTQTATS